jgi:carboxypeptidase family protein
MGMTRRIGVLGTLLAVLVVSSCRTGRPLIDRSHEDKTAHGTIGGILRGPGDAGGAIAGRHVTAVDTRSSVRYAAVTNAAGGFSIEVPPGKYRLQVELLDGEAVVKGPGIIDIGPSDVDANIAVEVGRAGSW